MWICYSATMWTRQYSSAKTFLEVFEDTDILGNLLGKKLGHWLCLMDRKPILTSVLTLVATYLSSQRPARKMSKNYVVPDYLLLTNIILQNKHISCRQRVV